MYGDTQGDFHRFAKVGEPVNWRETQNHWRNQMNHANFRRLVSLAEQLYAIDESVSLSVCGIRVGMDLFRRIAAGRAVEIFPHHINGKTEWRTYIAGVEIYTLEDEPEPEPEARQFPGDRIDFEAAMDEAEHTAALGEQTPLGATP